MTEARDAVDAAQSETEANLEKPYIIQEKRCLYAFHSTWISHLTNKRCCQCSKGARHRTGHQNEHGDFWR